MDYNLTVDENLIFHIHLIKFVILGKDMRKK